MPDNRAAGVSTASLPQVTALSKLDPTISVNCFTARNYQIKFGAGEALCYERTRDQGTLGSIAIAIVEPLGGHLFMYLIGHIREPPRGGSALTNIT
jgi:hypothetical protein